MYHQSSMQVSQLISANCEVNLKGKVYRELDFQKRVGAGQQKVTLVELVGLCECKEKGRVKNVLLLLRLQFVIVSVFYISHFYFFLII